jgi:hypothetical protein
MSWPDVNPEFETFLEPTRIWLFGKEFKSIVYVPGSMQKAEDPDLSMPSAAKSKPPGQIGTDKDKDTYPPAFDSEWDKYPPDEAKKDLDKLGMPPPRIERKLRRENQIFARIYSFSFEGHYYRLPRPLLFLPAGKGVINGATRRGYRPPDEIAGDPDIFTRHAAFNTKFTGTVGEDWQFSDDVRVWAVDRKDLAVCLDIEIGNYQEVLLEPLSRRMPTSRSDMISRSDMVSRSDMISRSSASAFRSDLGPHQNW